MMVRAIHLAAALCLYALASIVGAAVAFSLLALINA